MTTPHDAQKRLMHQQYQHCPVASASGYFVFQTLLGIRVQQVSGCATGCQSDLPVLVLGTSFQPQGPMQTK